MLFPENVPNDVNKIFIITHLTFYHSLCLTLIYINPCPKPSKEFYELQRTTAIPNKTDNQVELIKHNFYYLFSTKSQTNLCFI